VAAVPLKTDHVEDVKLLADSEGMLPDLDLSGGLSGLSGPSAYQPQARSRGRILGEGNGPTDLMHALDQQAGTEEGKAAFDGTGRHDRGPDSGIHNMAGAPYGLPGYKESHDWVNDVDIFSPLVFEWHFYGASLDTPTTSEIESKTAWETYLAQDQASAGYPNCAIGNPDFNVNSYMAANEMTGVSCGTAVQEYLQTGVYEGKKSYNAVQYFADESLTSPAYAVTNNAHGLYPKDTFYPDEAATFTWSMWVKNGEDGVGKTTNKWQDLINIRKKSGTHSRDYNIIAGGGNGNQVVMIWLRGFGLSWMPCSPWDNSLRNYGSTATTFRASGASPNFESDSKSSWFQKTQWYHVVHTFQPVGSSYDSTLYINGKKCVTSRGNGQPDITKYSKFHSSGSCRSQGGLKDCGGPFLADGSSGWRSDKIDEMALMRHFPKQALTDDMVSALYVGDKTAMPCLAGESSCL
jgi:hypothetical protein